MKIDEIISLLDSNTIDTIERKDETQSFVNVVLISGPIDSAVCEDDTACFIRASRYNLAPQDILIARAFFIYMDEPLKTMTTSSNIVTFKVEEDFFAAFMILAKEFRVLARRKADLLDLTRSVNEGASIRELVNSVSKIFDAPCSVLDTSLAYIAKSDRFPSYIAKESNNINALPDDAIEYLTKLNLVNPHRETEVTVFPYENRDDGCKCVYNHMAFIRSKNSLIGSVSLFTIEKPFRQSYIDMFPAVAQLLGIVMQRSDIDITSRSYLFSRIFDQLESSGIENERSTMRRRLDSVGCELRQYLNAVVVDYTDDALTPTQAAWLAGNIRALVPNSIYVVRNGEIVIFNSSDEHSPTANANLKELAIMLEGSHVQVGFSNVFIDTTRTRAALDQARRAIKVGRTYRPDEMLHLFEDLSLIDLLSNVNDPALLYSYRYPPLLKLIDYDWQHASKLALTLYTHLQSPGNPEKIAGELFIHKNTLYYRMDKIRKIMGVDISSADVIAKIYVAFLVLKLQNRFEIMVTRENEPAMGDKSKPLTSSTSVRGANPQEEKGKKRRQRGKRETTRFA